MPTHPLHIIILAAAILAAAAFALFRFYRHQSLASKSAFWRFRHPSLASKSAFWRFRRLSFASKSAFWWFRHPSLASKSAFWRHDEQTLSQKTQQGKVHRCTLPLETKAKNFFSLIYSVRMLSTGLRLATLNVCHRTERTATDREMRTATTSTHHGKSMR